MPKLRASVRFYDPDVVAKAAKGGNGWIVAIAIIVFCVAYKFLDVHPESSRAIVALICAVLGAAVAKRMFD